MKPSRAGPAWAQLGDCRWHLQHGPIDLIVQVEGQSEVVQRALTEAWGRFQSLLPELVSELHELRRPVHQQPMVRGAVAARMLRACAPFAAERFITSMAAVAGAVADELITLFRRCGITRAFINNGGDIALHLSDGQSYRVGICADVDAVKSPLPAGTAALDSRFEIAADVPVRGIATSGWRGRSFSLGIADSVTVLAADAAGADAAATMIANAVNCQCDGIVRRPANELKDDSDLGSLPVTVQVPALPSSLVAEALERGRREGCYWQRRGLIYAAALFLQGQVALLAPLRAPQGQSSLLLAGASAAAG